MLWRFGGGSKTVAKGADVEDVNVAAAPEGRLWVVWHEGGSKTIYAARTNKAATRLGAIAKVAPAKGTSSIWKLKGEGSRGPLDVLASVTTGSSRASWHTQVWPTLSLTAKTANGAVTFTVTDAGDPVAGARVAYAGKAATSNAQGVARVTVQGAPASKATATKAAYNRATVTVRPR